MFWLRFICFTIICWPAFGTEFAVEEAQNYNLLDEALMIPNKSPEKVESPVQASNDNNFLRTRESQTKLDWSKSELIRMQNGMVDLSDDTQLWVGPLGASLKFKY